MKANPYPQFVFEKWAYGYGLREGAQYTLEDGYYSPARAKLESVTGAVIAFLFGCWWWTE